MLPQVRNAEPRKFLLSVRRRATHGFFLFLVKPSFPSFPFATLTFPLVLLRFSPLLSLSLSMSLYLSLSLSLSVSLGLGLLLSLSLSLSLSMSLSLSLSLSLALALALALALSLSLHAQEPSQRKDTVVRKKRGIWEGKTGRDLVLSRSLRKLALLDPQAQSRNPP